VRGPSHGQDLDVNPTLLEGPYFALLARIAWWEDRVPDSMLGETTAIRNRVNGGSIGLPDVKTLTNTVRAMSVIEGTEDTAGVAKVVTGSALAGVMGYVVGALLLALAISAGASWLLLRDRDELLTDAGQQAERAGQSQAVALTCGRKVEALADEATRRKAEAARSRRRPTSAPSALYSRPCARSPRRPRWPATTTPASWPG
jgi:hypothetical protein